MIVMQIHTQIKTYTVHTLCTDRMFFISYHLVWFCGRCFRAGSDVSKRVINHPGSQFFPSFSVMKTADGDLVDLLLFFCGKVPWVTFDDIHGDTRYKPHHFDNTVGPLHQRECRKNHQSHLQISFSAEITSYACTLWIVGGTDVTFFAKQKVAKEAIWL